MNLTDILEADTVQGLISSIIAAIVLLGLWLLWRAVRGRLERVLGQTENSHEGTEYPNLRDEVTAIRMLTEANAKASIETAAAVKGLASTVQEDRNAQRSETEGVRADVRAIGTRVDLHIATSMGRGAPPSDPA